MKRKNKERTTATSEEVGSVEAGRTLNYRRTGITV